ncbi:unnamed protein product [Aureobasidium mustum]|uniref:C2H2-type domain-containing protein n=1 Tax=Aureobasidium mustum TaxID=2773714 RepID=A0A9N8JF32_9PEZI|nr:unnamed protein product [Aureobasidium mustum]
MSYECDSCDREFYSWNGARQHMSALDHWKWPYECNSCERRFGSQRAADQHMSALNHWDSDSSSSDDDEIECDKCDQTFVSWEACSQHMTSLNHWFTDVCDTCSRRFVNRHALEQHMDHVGHKSSHYCSSCDRHFRYPSDLFQHLNSPIHLRTEPIHTAPATPIRSTTTRQSAPTAATSHILPVPGAPDATGSQPTSRPSARTPAANATSARLSVRGQTVIPSPAVVPTLPSSSALPDIQSTCAGTGSSSFSVFVEKTSSCPWTPYRTFSFDELRLADYRAGRKPVITSERPGIFGQSNDSTSAVVSLTACAPTNVRLVYHNKSTQTDASRPASSLYLSAASSRATTPDFTAATTPTGSASFHHIHETHSKLMKLVKNDDGELEWKSQAYGPVRIVVSKQTLTPRMVHMSVPVKGQEEPESFMCRFDEEAKAEELLDKLHKAIAEAQASSDSSTLFSLSEIKVQHTEPAEKPEVGDRPFCCTGPPKETEIVNCPFCRLGFYAVSDVIQHLETTSCLARSDLNRSNIHLRLEAVATNLFLLLAALHAHFEGEECLYTDHEKLREAVGNFELVVPPFGSC